MLPRKYKRLSQKERVIIEALWVEGYNKSYIARKLKRSCSTISREIGNWEINPQDQYDSTLAHNYAVSDKHYRGLERKLDYNKSIKLYVFRGLLAGYSPDIISGRMPNDYPLDMSMRISHEAIYQYIYQYPQAMLNKKLIQLLHRHKRFRGYKSTRLYKRGLIKDSVSIEQRPKEVNKRLNIGDFEGDLIIGKGQQSAIGTMVDRKSRFVYIVKMSDRKSKTVVNSFIASMKSWPVKHSRTMTYDNGKEMSEHKLFTRKTGMPVYFAHPYSSWERGTNENTNGLIRRFFPKGTDFNQVSAEDLQEVQDWLNNRPRKILGYKSPIEVLEAHDNIFSFFNQLHPKKLLGKRKKPNFEALKFK